MGKTFPSPCGVLVLKSLGGTRHNTTTSFPSPCGVLVLKFSDSYKMRIGGKYVSVPLRGSGS